MAHALIRLKVQAEKSRLYHTDVIERGVLSGDLADRWSVLPRAAMRSCSQQPCQSYAVVGPAHRRLWQCVVTSCQDPSHLPNHHLSRHREAKAVFHGSEVAEQGVCVAFEHQQLYKSCQEFNFGI